MQIGPALRAIVKLVGQLVILVGFVASVGCNAEFQEPGIRNSLQTKVVVFQGTVLKMAPNPQTQTGSVFIVYQLAKYRVNRVCKGLYSGEEIVVDHLMLSSKELEGVKVGDTVCVTVEQSNRIYYRWSYPGIREESETPETYYVGGKVKPSTDANCDCAR